LLKAEAQAVEHNFELCAAGKTEEDTINHLQHVYRQTRDWEWTKRQLERMNPVVYLKRNYLLQEDLIRDGHGDWVTQKLETFAFDQNDFTYGNLLTTLVSQGHAEWVVSHIQFPDATRGLSPREIELVSALCRRGKSEWVLGQIERMSWEGAQPSKIANLLVILVEAGQSEWVASAIKQGSFGLDATNEQQLVVELTERELGHLVDNVARPPNLTIKDTKETSIDPRALSFNPQEICVAIESQAKHEETKRKKTREAIMLALWQARRSEPNPDPLQDSLLRWVDNLHANEMPFVELTIKGTGVLSGAFARFVSFERGERSSFVIEINKTDSSLFVYGKRDHATGMVEITFVNDIPEAASLAWTRARDAGIPVAPILRPPVLRNDGTVRFYSRFCGRTAYSYENDFGIPLALRTWIRQEMERIIRKTNELGTRHGHPHPGNFTVEFYRSEYLDRETAQGKTVNDVPFTPTDVTFDPIPYLERPDAWTPVVRLIDWDQATSPER